MPKISSPIPLALMTTLVLGAGCPEPDAGLGPGGGGPSAGPQGGGAPGNVDPGATRPDDARFKNSGPDAITVSGTFQYDGAKTGSYRLDFLNKDGDSPPRLVNTVEIDKPGPWKINAPRDYGNLFVVAFIDQKGDGPSPDDPSGRTAEPLVIGSEDLTGITVVVTDAADLGDLKPGANDGPPPPPPMMPEGEAEGPPPADTPQGTPAPATGEPTPPTDVGEPQ